MPDVGQPQPGEAAAADGSYDYNRWFTSEFAQRELGPIQEFLKTRFPSEPLQAGYVGLAFDNANHQAVVVVDPKLVQMEALQKQLSELGSGTDVRVGPACNSAADLVQAQAVIAAESKELQAEGVTYDYFVDPYTSTITVSLDRGHAEAGAALANKLGDLGTVTESAEIGRAGGRLDESQPHTGGIPTSTA